MGKQTVRSQQVNTHRNKDSITIIVAIIAGIIVLTILAIFVYVTVFRQSVPKEMESPIAVSYTHLDVYKRQVMIIMPMSLREHMRRCLPMCRAATGLFPT